jgi:hypothetical protein
VAATSHRPLDFLNPPEGASLVAVEGKGFTYPWTPEPLIREVCAAVDVEATLKQLRHLSTRPEQGIDVVSNTGLDERLVNWQTAGL